MMLNRSGTLFIALVVAVLAMGLAAASSAPRIASGSQSKICELAPEFPDVSVKRCNKTVNDRLIPCPSNFACVPETMPLASRGQRDSHRLFEAAVPAIVRIATLFRPPRAAA